MEPKGIRNNNPLNIRKGKNPWVGEISSPQGEVGRGLFCQFSTMQDGWRAAFLLLKKYMNAYKLRTVAQIIRRWAPPTENNTEAYIRSVCERSHIDRNEALSFYDRDRMMALASAMCVQENGPDFDPESNADWRYAQLNGYIRAFNSTQWGERALP